DKVNLKLIAAKGHVNVQAQSGDVEIVGDKNVRIYANKEKLTAAAKEELLLNCGGAYIRLSGGKIDIHAPGKISVKGSNYSFSGPSQMQITHAEMLAATPQPFSTKAVIDKQLEEWLVGGAGSLPYRFVNQNGEIVGKGLLDEYGRTQRVFQSSGESLRLFLGTEGEWHVDQIRDDDETGCDCGGEHAEHEAHNHDIDHDDEISTQNLALPPVSNHQEVAQQTNEFLTLLFKKASIKTEIENGED
uniref:DUF2345 domain-containing protein n=1 Tax=Chitinolyticbacter albus TaxID=2961951 RepID=UPI00210B7A1D